MENFIENKPTPQKQILKPIRTLSLNQTLQFLCVINESTIAYIGGNSLIIQNFKTLKQEILWSGENFYEIISVTYSNCDNCYGPIKFAFVLKNVSERMYEIVIFYVDWNNYFYQRRNQVFLKLTELVVLGDVRVGGEQGGGGSGGDKGGSTDGDKTVSKLNRNFKKSTSINTCTYPTKDKIKQPSQKPPPIPPPSSPTPRLSSFSLEFNHTGQYLAMYTIQKNNHYISIYDTKTTKLIKKKILTSQLITMRALNFYLVAQCFLVLVYGSGIQAMVMDCGANGSGCGKNGKEIGILGFGGWKLLFEQICCSVNQNITNVKDNVNVNTNLKNKKKIKYKQQFQHKNKITNQQIIQIQFGKNHTNEVLGFVLTNHGNFFIFKVFQSGIQGVFKIEACANKKTMKLKHQENKMDLMQLQLYSTTKINTLKSIKFLQNPQILRNQPIDQYQNHNHTNLLLNQYINPGSQSGSESIFNSHHHHHHHHDYSTPSTQQLQKTQQLLPTYFTTHNNRIMLGYQNTRKLIYITFSLINYQSYSVCTTDNQIYFPNQKIDNQHILNLHNLSTNTNINTNINLQQKNKITQNIKDKQQNTKVLKICLSHNICTAGLLVKYNESQYIIIVDVLNSLVPRQIQKQKKTNSSNFVYGNFSFRGVCKSVCYCYKESSIFVLYENFMEESFLAYYNLNYCTIEFQNPYELLLWQISLKSHAYSISLHPLNYSILILYTQLPKIHFYTFQKFSQHSITLNIPNVQCGRYSLYGDKIILCNYVGIYILDSYSYEIFNMININYINTNMKIPRNIQFINGFEMVVEYGVGGGSYLLHVSGYKKMKTLGQIYSHINQSSKISFIGLLEEQQMHQYQNLKYSKKGTNQNGRVNVGYECSQEFVRSELRNQLSEEFQNQVGRSDSENKKVSQSNNIITNMKNNYMKNSVTNLQPLPNMQNLPNFQSTPTPTSKTLIQYDLKRQFIIYAHIGHQLRFYNFKMDILNIILIQPEYIYLCQQIQALFVGTTKGTIYIFKYPEIINKVTDISSGSSQLIDPEIIAIRHVHKDRIISISLSINLRYIVVVSETGEISLHEFLQQNSKNINRRSALAMLKKNQLEPVIKYCLTSVPEEHRRTQTVTKTIGKQVEITKKFQQKHKELIKKLDQRINQQTFKTQILIKDEMDYCVQQKNMRLLMRKIEHQRRQLQGLEERYGKMKNQQNIRFQDNVLDMYKQKDILQKQYDRRSKNHIQQITKYKQMHQKQYKQQVRVYELQEQNLKKDMSNIENIHKKYVEKQTLQGYKLQQTKIETIEVINLQNKEQLEELYRVKNELQIQEKKLINYNRQLNQKISSFMLMTMELEKYLQLLKENRRDGDVGEDFRKKLEQVKQENQLIVYENIIQEKNKEDCYRNAKYTEQKYQDHVKNLQKLTKMYNNICQRKEELEDEFFQQNKRNINIHQNLQEMRKKIIQLKDKRDRVKREAVFGRKKVQRLIGVVDVNGKMDKSICQKRYNDGSQCEKKRIDVSESFHVKSRLKRDTHFVESKQKYKNLYTCKSQSNSLHMSLQSPLHCQKTNPNKIQHHDHNPTQPQSQSQVQQQQTYIQNLQKRNKRNQTIQKLNKIKNEKIKKYKLINDKLINDRKRLIYQLNQLKRYNDLLYKKQQKLVLDIRKCLSSEGEGVWEGLGERFGEDLVEEDEGGSNGDSGNTKNYVLQNSSGQTYNSKLPLSKKNILAYTNTNKPITKTTNPTNSPTHSPTHSLTNTIKNLNRSRNESTLIVPVQPKSKQNQKKAQKQTHAPKLGLIKKGCISLHQNGSITIDQEIQ